MKTTIWFQTILKKFETILFNIENNQFLAD